MRLIAFKCANCGKPAEKPSSAVNRARRSGLLLFCNRRCSGLSRRSHKTKAQRVEEKRLYDAEYRRLNLDLLNAKKRAYFAATYDPEKARIERKKTMRRHVEYCRRPEYKKWKRWYDAEHRAKEYGPFAEAYRTLLELTREVRQRINTYESQRQNQTFGKIQARRRAETGDRRRHHSPADG